MATSTKTSIIPTTNPYLVGLLRDDGATPNNGPEVVRHWSTASSVTFYLQPGDYDRNGFNDWTENGAGAAIVRALAAWQSVCGVTFQEVFTTSQANLVERIGGAGGNLGTHQYPHGSGVSVGDFNEGASVYNDGSNNAIGSFSYTTFVHELGHALGLEHPHSDGGDDFFPGVSSAADTGDNGLNQQIWTVMSYNRGWDGDGGDPTTPYGWVGTPMAFDIAAVQLLYGKNMTTAIGNNTYVLPMENQPGTYYGCIWDAGGVDTLRADPNTLVSVIINLNDATLKNELGGAGYLSRQTGVFGGFTIANGVAIENATGGGGNDTLTGNEYDNRLAGRAGDDVLIGGMGRDTLIGGPGNDTYHLGAETDALDIVQEFSPGGVDTIKSSITRSLATTEYTFIEGLILTGSSAINGTGNASNNAITGNTAANVLDGGGGTDVIRGRDGDDVVFGSGGADTLWGDAGNDRFFYFETADSPRSARDRVLDFDDSGNDVIDLRPFLGDAELDYIGVGLFTRANQVAVSQSLADVVVSINLDSNILTSEVQIILVGTTILSMTASDFLL